MSDTETRPQLTPRQYGKLSDWSERFALVVFGSLVIQQLTAGASWFFIAGGIILTALAYAFAYLTLKKNNLTK